jgi:probable HAF family extracellular repeat protein
MYLKKLAMLALTLSLAVSAASLVKPEPSYAGSYNFTTFDYPYSSPDQLVTMATGINNSGTIVGLYNQTINNPWTQPGFIRDGIPSAYSSFSYPGTETNSNWSFLPISINDNGVIAGSYFLNSSPGNGSFGFIKVGDNYSSFSYPNATFTYAYGINNSNQVVGFTSDFISFVKDGDNFTSFNYPADGSGTHAYGINDKGQIVGVYTATSLSSYYRGFVKDGNNYSSFDLPGNGAIAYGINNSGQIVGTYQDDRNVKHGFIINGDTITTLDYPGGLQTEVFGINDNGDIVGYGYAGGNVFGFVASPTPVPPSVLLFASGLIGLVGLRRCRKKLS